MIVPVATDGNLVLVRQYCHNLKARVLEFPAGTVSDGEQAEAAELRELEEETGYAHADGAALRPMGACCSLLSETNKYTPSPAPWCSPETRPGTPRSRSTST